MLRLQGRILLIWSRIGVSLSEHNDSYPEPDGRSGTHVLIKLHWLITSGINLVFGLADIFEYWITDILYCERLGQISGIVGVSLSLIYLDSHLVYN